MKPSVLALAALLVLAPPAAWAAEDTVTHAVFEPGRFAAIAAPVELRYRFEVQGQGIDGATPSPVRLEVRTVGADGTKEVWLDMFEGAARRNFGPVSAREQNPLIIEFLQRDVVEMGNLTGGAPGYFQQQIRRAFALPWPTEAVSVELDGKSVPATRITMRPFAQDPNIARFPQFRDKAYELTVADGVPGGLWRIAARTPDPKTGGLILEKSMTFETVEPHG
jgi:hypothetical protein